MNLYFAYTLKVVTRFLISGIFLILFFTCSKQEKNDHYVINGQIEANIDTVFLYPGFAHIKFIDSSFYGFSSVVKESKFSFEGEIPHPFMFLFYSKAGVSKNFFIENGYSQLSLSRLDGDKEVTISESTKSDTQREYELLRETILDSIDDLILNSKSDEDYNKMRAVRDSIMVSHLKLNPNSYVALWYFIDRFSKYNLTYNEEYENALKYFSKEIQATHAFKVLKESLIESKEFSISNKSFNLKNLNLEESEFNINDFNSKKYILLDFWFSRCVPCLVEMPNYIPIYNKYKDRGFEIISISVDETKDILNWKEVISKKGFEWVHFLDENGLETKKLYISSFPSTFLIDDKGKILMKNVSADELEKFLNNSLN